MKNTFFFFKQVLPLFFLVFQFLYVGVCHAQSEIEDLELIIQKNERDTVQFDAYIELYKLESMQASQKAKAYLDQGMILARKIDYERGKALAFLCYGDYYGLQGNLEFAIEMLNNGKTIYDELNDHRGSASCLNNLGGLKYKLGDYNGALECYLETARINEEIGDSSGLAIAQHNIGGLHYDQGNFDKAKEYWQKSLDLEYALKDSIGIIYGLNAIGAVHTAKKEYDKALEMMHAALNIANKFGDISIRASITLNIGVQHQRLDQFEKAKGYYLQSLDLYKQIDDDYELSIQYFNLGKLECDLNNGEKAIAYFDTSLVIADSIGAPQLMEHSFGGMADANKLLGNYEEAFDWLEKWNDIQDSLKGEKVKIQLNELQEKYETELKDNEIAQLQKKKAEATLTADRRKWLLIIYSILFVSAALVLIFYLEKRKAREQQRRAELEQKALRAQMNPHFIFNSLGAIQQMYVTGELDLANNYMGDFGSLMRKILDNSGKDLISVKEELEMLKLYLELEKSRNIELFDYAIEIDERIDRLGTKIPPMIIQPFVENAIWHGILPSKKKGKVIVRLNCTKNADMIVCEIEDNGIGIQQQVKRKKYESKGMKITEQRLGTKVRVRSLSPGTCITIKIMI